MEPLKPNGQRAKIAIVFIYIVLGFEILSLLSGYFQYNLLQEVSSGGIMTPEAATANDTRERIVGILYLIAYIASAVTFIQWFRRAYSNLHLRVDNLSHPEGWAAGSWFVPIINLYRPFHIMKELQIDTCYVLAQKGVSKDENDSTQYIGWWWSLWILNNFIGQFVFRYSLNAESIAELTTSTVASMVGNLVGIPLALLTVKVIKDYAKLEPLLQEIKETDPNVEVI